MYKMNRKQTNDYIASHGKRVGIDKVFLEKPLFGFKYVKAANYGIEQYNKNNLKIKDGVFLDTKNRKLISQALNSYVYDAAVANLIIPVGSFVNLAQGESCKARASQAFCWDIIRLKEKQSRNSALVAWSTHDHWYYYFSAKEQGADLSKCIRMANLYEGQHIHGLEPRLFHSNIHVPNGKFDMTKDECSSGIHFFVEPKRAERYY
jgi:hypothetical protein